jgi:hypothetical protein
MNHPISSPESARHPEAQGRLHAAMTRGLRTRDAGMALGMMVELARLFR